MYQYTWDAETGGLLLTVEQSKFSKEPRPVYYKELDILGFDKYWNYPKDDSAPLLWAEANNYIYKGRNVARTKGGSLYTRPELILLEDPEPDGAPLQFVDIQAMCEKNTLLMDTLVQETVQKIYNTYLEYKDKIDVFYVAFSGGKDSVVALDMVQRALPHDQFKVLFGDTQMEFVDTYNAAMIVREKCEREGIEFLTAKSEFKPIETWAQFGPPATVNRWCCSVHKTAPQILLLRERTGKSDFTGMAFVGVRADESAARSKYEYITYGGKHKGQYSCNVILDWSSAEVFLNIFINNLVLNETYKKGNRRAGCLICPRAAERNDYMNHFCYSKEADELIGLIKDAYRDNFQTEERLNQFIEVGGWKARKNGRDINIPLNYSEATGKNGEVTITVKKPKTDWREWIKTIGVLLSDGEKCSFKFRNEIVEFSHSETTDLIKVTVDAQLARTNIDFVKMLKSVFRKSACCIGCCECQADCPYGNLHFVNGKVKISDGCRHCAQCHKAEKGCLVYKSLEMPKGGVVMAGKSKSLNSYSHHAPKMEWIDQYFEYKNEFNNNHNLGSQMFDFFKKFLRDAKLLDETGFSTTAEVVDSLGYTSESAWGIIAVNLCDSAQINWFYKNVDFDMLYSKKLLASMLIDSGAKESWTNDIFASITRMTELPLGQVGFGFVDKTDKKNPSISRVSWSSPVPEVILYSLYKFAEACDGYYQFSLSTLMDDTIEREGISPTRIFGLDHDAMVSLLNGLSINYPEFINVSFTLDLETITLREDKTAKDVLALF